MEPCRRRRHPRVPGRRIRPGPRLLVLAGALLSAACGAGGDPGAAGGEAAAAVARPARPATRGLDPALLAGAQARGSELPRLRSLLVARHGTLEREWYFHGAGPDDAANVKSASKSILSALVGIAIAEGHLEGPDQPIRPFFEADLPLHPDPRLDSITVGHLLSMRAGLESTSFAGYGRWVTSRNWVRYALARPFVAEPGGRMVYSTGNTHLLSALLTRATGTSTLAYARSRLGEPLGIAIPTWPRDPQGIFFGGNDMRLRPRDLLRFGELYRNGGRHQGRQLVPEEWVRESWIPRTSSPYNGHGYGYGWWIREARGYRVNFAWGYGGQFVFVVPELELTVVATSDASPPRQRGHLGAVHALLDDWILPAAEKGAAPPPAAPLPSASPAPAAPAS